MNRTLVVVLATVLLCGCSVRAARPLVVDPTCPVGVSQAVAQVATEWDHAIPGLEVTVQDQGAISVRCNGAPPNPTGKLAILAQSPMGGPLEVWPEEQPWDQLVRTLRHELGHFLGAVGLYAHPPDGQAMRDAEPSSWTCINAKDIDAVCRGRGTLLRPWGCRGEVFQTCPPP